MKRIEIKGDKTIFDGTEPSFYTKRFQIVADHQVLNFSLKDFRKNQLLTLKKSNPTIDFKSIINHHTFIFYKNIDYRTEQDQLIYFYIKDNYLILLSYGEWQPARYIIHAESVWRL